MNGRSGRQWTKLYLEPTTGTLAQQGVSQGSAQLRSAGGRHHLPQRSNGARDRNDGTFGAQAVRIILDPDADLFVVLRTGDLKEVFQGAIDPHTPVGQGWLLPTASSIRSFRCRIALSQARQGPAAQEGEVTELDVGSGNLNRGPGRLPRRPHHSGEDYVYRALGGKLSAQNELTGCGPFLHDDQSIVCGIFGRI